MGRSCKYIDYKAYVGYLRRMTCQPADPDALHRIIVSFAAGRSEMQTAYVLLKALSIVAAVILAVTVIVAAIVALRHIF